MNPSRSPAQIVSAIVGFLMFAVSSPCVIAMIHDLITQADNLQGALIVGTFFGFVGFAGILMMIFGLRKPKGFAITEQFERQVLGLARTRGGRLTIAEVAVESNLSIDQARAVLEHFEHREACRPHLSDSGDFVYVFPGLTVDKNATFDPLDSRADFDAFDAELAFDDEVEFGVDGDVGETSAEHQATAQATSKDSW